MDPELSHFSQPLRQFEYVLAFWIRRELYNAIIESWVFFIFSSSRKQPFESSSPFYHYPLHVHSTPLLPTLKTLHTPSLSFSQPVRLSIPPVFMLSDPLPFIHNYCCLKTPLSFTSIYPPAFFILDASFRGYSLFLPKFQDGSPTRYPNNFNFSSSNIPSTKCCAILNIFNFFPPLATSHLYSNSMRKDHPYLSHSIVFVMPHIFLLS